MSFGKRTPAAYFDRRGAPREPTYANGQILVPGMPPRACLIDEFSGTGARLQMQSIFGVPNEFDLCAFGRIYPAQVVRRKPRTLMVAFQ